MLSTNKAYLDLQATFDPKKLNLVDLFAQDPQRYEKFHRTLNTPDGKILLDFSKNLITQDIFQRLIEVVKIFYF